MSNKVLLKRLKEMASELGDNVPDLNRGGCGIAALAIHKHLSAHVDCELVVINGNGPVDIDKLLETKPALLNESSGYRWCRSGVDFHHIAVTAKIGGTRYIIDSDGVVPHRTYARDKKEQGLAVCKGTIPIPTLKKLVDHVSNWNPTYSRKKTPTVKKIVKTHFKQLTTA